MKIFFIFYFVVLFIIHQKLIADTPDSAFIFCYATEKNDAHNGLHFAWSQDNQNWHAIGPEFSYIKSDFGAWGSQKKMFDPYVFYDNQGKWHCIWTLNNEVGQFAHSSSNNLSFWWRQSYPEVMEDGNCLQTEIFYDNSNEEFVITWKSKHSGKEELFKTTTSDFRHYTKTKKITSKYRKNNRATVEIGHETFTGTIHKVSWKMIEDLIKEMKISKYEQNLYSEKTIDDAERFASLEPVNATITIDYENKKSISDLLIGIFFEDINYAADGGLYAELIQNRDFEYNPDDRSEWDHMTSWKVSDNIKYSIDTVNPIHPNNKHYLKLEFNNEGAGLVNEGYGGIEVKHGEQYNFSTFVKSFDKSENNLVAMIVNNQGKVIAKSELKSITNQWTKVETSLIAKETASSCKLTIVFEKPGKLALDMISLFPKNTFNGHKNGLRADLAQAIADIHPKFVRFPGGCVAHGNGLNNIYRWKNTIGPLEARTPQPNIWRYHQTAGLGYFEYFQFCEDIDAEPIPIIAAGVPCQNSSIGGHGQQGGIPICDMDEYVQDILDLIEWANGDKNTTWGKKRAEAGHPEPFNLKYIGIGNEDLITDVFEERFKLIYNILQEKHPDINVIGTVGPFYKGTDYEEGWKIATELEIPIVDEHYYQTPGWFIYNQDFYDRYDRSKSKVYLGEYASHLPGRPNNLETALSEALYMTSLERNGDVVVMSSYAPLLAKENRTQWNPDLIYFNNKEVKPTVGYHVQKLYGQNSGTTYIPGKVALSNSDRKVINRVAMSVVQDEKSNDIIIKLVNMLPVEVNSSIYLGSLNIKASEGKLSVLKGKPDDRMVKPVAKVISVDNTFYYQMSPYSFSVMRIETK